MLVPATPLRTSWHPVAQAHAIPQSSGAPTRVLLAKVVSAEMLFTGR